MKRIRSVTPTLLVMLFVCGITRAGVPYETSKHGHPETGVQRLPEEGPGACGQCHEKHASRDGVPTGGPFNRMLFMIDDETLCYECHSAQSANRVYPDNVTWADSTHATSPLLGTSKCVNCHDPHATEDALGVIPSMLRAREESLCLGCHDRIGAQLGRAYTHPVASGIRHNAAEGNNPSPAQYDASGTENRRHAECADCHNPHIARGDYATINAPEASQRLHGVARISVVNGPAGDRPAYTWKGADDLLDPREYEICFKCHSSWTQLPAGRPDLAVLTNPNNPSYHPIQARGKNSGIDAGSFENGLTWDSTVHCADCHGSDDTTVRGPHGSSNRYILRRASPDLCYACHRYDVYGDPLATDATQSLSRFNKRVNGGHAYHTGEQNVTCAVCHATHGSTEHPALIVDGRTPGIILYAQNAGGGTCTPTCHGTQSYTVNYGR